MGSRPYEEIIYGALSEAVGAVGRSEGHAHLLFGIGPVCNSVDHESATVRKYHRGSSCERSRTRKGHGSHIVAGDAETEDGKGVEECSGSLSVITDIVQRESGRSEVETLCKGSVLTSLLRGRKSEYDSFAGEGVIWIDRMNCIVVSAVLPEYIECHGAREVRRGCGTCLDGCGKLPDHGFLGVVCEAQGDLVAVLPLHRTAVENGPGPGSVGRDGHGAVLLLGRVEPVLIPVAGRGEGHQRDREYR